MTQSFQGWVRRWLCKDWCGSKLKFHMLANNVQPFLVRLVLSTIWQRFSRQLSEGESIVLIWWRILRQGFETWKNVLTFTPILVAPNWTRPFELMCNVSCLCNGHVYWTNVGRRSCIVPTFNLSWMD